MAENFYGATDIGSMRNNNEDAFIAQMLGHGHFIAASVIDGVGGYEGGEVAAAIAKSNLIRHLNKLQSAEGVVSTMRNAIAAANHQIYAEKNEAADKANMACVLTLVLADVKSNKFYYAHVGDTRLYLFRDQSLVKVTKDQSFVGFLEDSGRLTEAEAMSHPKRNEINNALGLQPEILTSDSFIETGESPFLPGDLLLLCSDGLTDMLASKQIAGILSQKTSLQQKCSLLIDAANHAGGRDNITVVLVKNTKKAQAHQAKMPKAIPATQSAKSVAAYEAQPPLKKMEAPKAQRTQRRSYLGAAIFLLILCVITGGAFFWYWHQQNKTVVPAVASKPMRQGSEINFQSALLTGADSILVSNDTLFTNPILVSDTLFIKKDSLYINGNGLVLQRDSSYVNGGPAIVITPAARHIVFENLEFRNFTLAIQAPAKALEFKNVKFTNCKVAIAYTFDSTEKVSGHFGFLKKNKKDAF